MQSSTRKPATLHRRHRSVDTGASGFDCDRPGTRLQESTHHAPLRVHDVGPVGHDLLFDPITQAGQHFQQARDALIEQALQFIAGGEFCSPQANTFDPTNQRIRIDLIFEIPGNPLPEPFATVSLIKRGD